jgi:Fur family peroxide stress response transcriptional regulator
MSKQLVERAQQVLQRSGMRLTPQRRTILEVLDESDAHLDAEALYHQAKMRDPRISLATVYRTLAALKEIGLVQQRHLTHDDQRGYYEIADQQHYHFACLRCGRVIEFDTPLLTQIQQEFADEMGVQVTRARLHLEGYCANCLAQ